MNAKAEQQSSALDIAKLVLAGVVLFGAIGLYYQFPEASTLLRVLGVLVAAVVAAGIAVTSAPGRALWSFATEARTEVRKVVWPTRQETVQTTLAVLVIVLIVALFLWGVDKILFMIVGALTGQGG
ncbi:MAG: preprotein translocase subunit SecE [Pseudomonadota bacterium]